MYQAYRGRFPSSTVDRGMRCSDVTKINDFRGQRTSTARKLWNTSVIHSRRMSICMSRYDRPSHQVYCYFFKRGGWQVQFLEPDLKTASQETHVCGARENQGACTARRSPGNIRGEAGAGTCDRHGQGWSLPAFDASAVYKAEMPPKRNPRIVVLMTPRYRLHRGVDGL